MSETGKNNKKLAVILFNLGGPDNLGNVRPFLYNLFSDKWIIRLPFYLRKLIAFIISTRRYKLAQENYKLMGGKTPLLEETNKQKNALEKELSKHVKDFKIFIAMRYWHPMSEQTAKEVMEYNPDEIIYLPLYPQLSSSTTISSFEEFDRCISAENFSGIIKKIGCYFNEENFINSHIKLIKEKLKNFAENEKVRILFSAHGIPEKYVEQGDPYQWQVKNTVDAICRDKEISKYENILCYQSRVGPIKWLTPNTEDEVERAAKENVNLVVVPVAFVSEHIETLVELDIEYKEIAHKHGIRYERVDALGIDEFFIKSLSSSVINSYNSSEKIICFRHEKCPSKFKNCVHRSV